MPSIEITIKARGDDTFKVEIDDEEDVESLSVVIMSQRPDLGEELKLFMKGKVLKDEQVIKDLGITASDFMAVTAKKPPAAADTPAPTPTTAPSAVDAMLAAAGNAGYNGVPMPAPPAPALAPTGAVGGGVDESVVQTLCAMGFDRAQVAKALQAAFNNPERAAEYLLTGIPAVEPEAPVAAPTGGAWPEAMLGPQLLTKAGLKPTKEALQSADVVLLYFSAHWCPPCRSFTPQLAAQFSYGSPPPNLTTVFISSDRDEASFRQYYNEMPWLAMPFSTPQRQMLGGQFGVRGIPSLVVLNGRTGAVISTNGKPDIIDKRFDLKACMAQWGFGPATAPVQVQSAPVVLGKPKETAPEKAEPPPAAIDDAVAGAALKRVTELEWEVQEPFFNTGMKVLNNILQNPGEQKFRQLKRTNAALSSKLLNVAENAGTELMKLAGFEATSEEMLVMQSEPDGRCTEVRNRLKSAHYTSWEKHARKERDAKIKEEMDKDKSCASRHYGGDGSGGGRNTYGADRHRGRGGG
jgi:thiol-disulfide isomerase/thioredoxin